MGIPTQVAGATTYTITATNSTGSARQTFTLTVTALPILTIEFTDQTLNIATVGSPYFDIVAAQTKSDGVVDNKTVSYALASGTLPPGLSLNSATGEISGTISNSAMVGDNSISFTASSTGYIQAVSTVISFHVVASSESGFAVQHSVTPPVSPLQNPSSATPPVAPLQTPSSATPPVAPLQTPSSATPHSVPQPAIGSVFFSTGSSVLDMADKLALDQMIQKLKALGIVKITITGLADGQGLTGGQKLSRARALSVANYLRSQHVQVKMTVVGKGVPLSTKLNQKSSRRVDISPAVDAAKL